MTGNFRYCGYRACWSHEYRDLPDGGWKCLLCGEKHEKERLPLVMGDTLANLVLGELKKPSPLAAPPKELKKTSRCDYCQKLCPEEDLHEDQCAAGLCSEGCGNASKSPEGCTMKFCRECHEMIYPERDYD